MEPNYRDQEYWKNFERKFKKNFDDFKSCNKDVEQIVGRVDEKLKRFEEGVKELEKMDEELKNKWREDIKNSMGRIVSQETPLDEIARDFASLKEAKNRSNPEFNVKLDEIERKAQRLFDHNRFDKD